LSYIFLAEKKEARDNSEFFFLSGNDSLSMQVRPLHLPPLRSAPPVRAAQPTGLGAFLKSAKRREAHKAVVDEGTGVVSYQVKEETFQAPFSARTESVVVDALTASGTDFDVVPAAPAPPLGLGDVISAAWIATLLYFAFKASPLSRIAPTEEATPVPDCSFAEVEGIDAARDELEQLVRLLRDPRAYSKAGATLPRGVLLCGPPGCGKTLLARALAGEAGVPFLQTSGSQFVEVYVGAGAARVRDVFKRARSLSPCIVFIDEIDALARKRSGGGPGGNDERDSTLNQLLVEMDGFESDQTIVVVGATNFPESLDAAVLRPGRFDRRVDIQLPSATGRLRILETHAIGKRVVKKKSTLSRVAEFTDGFSGADLRNLLNEAAIAAVECNNGRITPAIIDEAYDRRVLGIRGDDIERDLHRVSVHEAGHALVAVLCGVGVRRISARSRGVTGGVTFLKPREGLPTKQTLEDDVRILLGGYAAESVIFDGDVSVGAQGDLQRVESILKNMATRSGMLGETFRAVDWTQTSEAKRADLDEAVGGRAAKLMVDVLVDLKNHRLLLEAIADALRSDSARQLSGQAFYQLINDSMPSP